MKKIYLLIVAFNVQNAFSQIESSEKFQIGNYIEVFKKDSLKIYFNCTGTIVDKSCALYYRVGKMDSTFANFKGEFNDYDMLNRLAFKANMFNSKLEGEAQYFHENGSVKEKGFYHNNKRVGKWVYYYTNGNIEKTIDFQNGESIIIDAYSTDGKATVVNGNGPYKTEFSKFKQCDQFETSGELVNGKRNGPWLFIMRTLSTPVSTEIYKDGRFIKGTSPRYDYNTAKTSFDKFYSNENLNMNDNLIGCPGDNLSFLQYDGSSLHISFFPELLKLLKKSKNQFQNQWMIVGLKINASGQLVEQHIASSINDSVAEANIIGILRTMNKWQGLTLNSSKAEANTFFTILIQNGKISIPTETDYKNGDTEN